MEAMIERMQDECTGVPVRTVKSFMSKVPSIFTGMSLHLKYASLSHTNVLFCQHMFACSPYETFTVCALLKIASCEF